MGFFLLFWNFFLLSCRLSDIPPLWRKKGVLFIIHSKIRRKNVFFSEVFNI